MTVTNPEGTIVHYPGEWRPIDGCPGYEVCDRGEARSLDRTIGGRQLRGVTLATRISNRGYVLVDVRDANGVKHTRTMHSLVLNAFAGPPRPGEEARHWNDDPLDNRWPENLLWGTKPQNAADKVRNGSPPTSVRPTYECLNFATCGNTVINEGRRCPACVQQVGVDAAAMLARGVNLMDVADHFGYTGPDWVHKLAVEYGGCTLTKRAALVQRPSRAQRLTATLRDRFRRAGR